MKIKVSKTIRQVKPIYRKYGPAKSMYKANIKIVV